MEGSRKKLWDTFRDWAFPFILALVFSISIYWFVSDFVRSNAQTNAKDELQTAFKNYTVNLAVRMNDLQMAGETASLMIGAYADDMQTEDMQIVADAIKESTGCSQVLVSDVDGNAVSSGGNQIRLDPEEYFTNTAGKLSRKVSYDFTTESSDGSAENTVNEMRVIIPVCHEGETEPHAYLICADNAVTWASDEETGKIKTAYRMIVNKNGAGFVLSGTIPENAREDIWIDLEAETGQKELGLKKKLSTSRTLAMDAEDGCRYYIVPLKTADDMYLVVKTEREAVQAKVKREMRKARKLINRMELVTAAFIILYAVYSWFRHNFTVKSKEKLEKSATTDPLTGLKNKATMEREVREYMEQNPGDQGLMFLLDIDDFKTINDSKGHAFGDQVLKEFSFRLSSYFRAADLIGRIGGDEFMVFCTHFSDEAAIAYKIESLQEFAKTFSVGTVMIQKVSCSIGLAYYPKDGADFETLYKAADQAMYRSKKGGKARVSV